MNKVVAGIGIGGTKIALGLADSDCRIIGKDIFPTANGSGPEAILKESVERLKKIAAAENSVISRIGIGCAGPLDIKNGAALSLPNIPGWENFKIRDFTSEISDVPVILDNDANAAALAEYKFGAGRGMKDLVYMTVSTGIGGGVISNGKLIPGITGNAGEVGHITVLPNGPQCGCGARGCLEALCSGTGIARRFKEILAKGESSIVTELVENTEDITSKTIADAVAAGDKTAKDFWEETCFFLSIGIGNIMVMFEPEAIIIGGGVSLTGDILFEPLRRHLRENIRIISPDNIKVIPAGLGSESGVYGALALALQ